MNKHHLHVVLFVIFLRLRLIYFNELQASQLHDINNEHLILNRYTETDKSSIEAERDF